MGRILTAIMLLWCVGLNAQTIETPEIVSVSVDIEVGIGKIKPESIPQIIESKNRAAAGFTAPPHGLVLLCVEY